jgi:hypothetical protein
MAKQKAQQKKSKGEGITNRGIDREKPAQDYVLDSIEGLEKSSQRDDLDTGERLRGTGPTTGRNLDTYVEDADLSLTPEEQSGGVRRIDSRDAARDHSHH